MARSGRFKSWKSGRPFWGATLSLLSGLIILWVPINLAEIAFLPGSMAFVGYLFGGLLILTSIMMYIYPQMSTVFGVFTIFFSVLSIMGALGGLFVGMLLGIIGGSLAVAWEQVRRPAERQDSDSDDEPRDRHQGKRRRRHKRRPRREDDAVASF